MSEFAQHANGGRSIDFQSLHSDTSASRQDQQRIINKSTIPGKIPVKIAYKLGVGIVVTTVDVHPRNYALAAPRVKAVLVGDWRVPSRDRVLYIQRRELVVSRLHGKGAGQWFVK